MTRLASILILYILLTSVVSLEAQDIPYPEYSGSFNSRPLKEVLETISYETDVSVFYHYSWTDNLTFTGDFKNSPLNEVLNDILINTDLSWLPFDENNIVLLNESKPLYLIDLIDREQSEPGGVIVIGDVYNKGKVAVITGSVIDGSTGDPVPGATLMIKELNDGVVTSIDGSYKLQVPTGRYSIIIESVGYEKDLYDIQVINSGIQNFELFEGATELNEVLITERRIDENIQSVQTGLEKMDVKIIRELPSFMGEIDIIKGLLILPGVSTVGEGAAGFNVRGGTVGQNLLLQDEAMIFNSSHLFGFFSAFNSDMVSGVNLYKGNPPAYEGGRLSSILDIKLKNGNNEKIHAQGGIGTVSSKLVIDGPIQKGKSSYVIGGRVSYVNWLLRTLNNPTLEKSSAHFYDLNARFNFNLGNKDIITLSGYKSYDDFTLISDTTFIMETQNASAIWRHSYNQDLLSNLSVAYGEFNNSTEDLVGLNSFKMNSYIHHLKSKLLFTYLFDNHTIDFGASAILYNMEPGNFVPKEGSANIKPIDVENETGLESAFFVNDEFKLNNTLSFTLGLRYSFYNSYGPNTVYLYEPGMPKDEETVIDSLFFGDGELIKSYGGIEPRFSARILLSSTKSLKIGYAKNRQYLHLISNTTAISPQDYWQSSNYHIPPEIGDQISAGYFQNLNNNIYEFSFEGFYKSVTNAVDYKEGSTVVLNEDLEQDIVIGDGRSYGLETMIKKNSGRLTGRISYTYSRSEVRFQSEVRSENISLGEYYPSTYDKPHDLTVLMNYQLSRGTKLSTNFTFSSGRPVTAPVSKYRFQHIQTVLNYSQRNQFRIPDYHRLDISLTFGVGMRKDRKVNDEIIFSVYNVYGRRNAYSVFFNQYGAAYRLSVLGTVFPSITYNFKI